MGRRRAALGVLVAALAAPGLASAGIGDLKGTKPGDFEFFGFVDADGCDQCHGGGVGADQAYLPSDTWAGTMMANAARDPVFFAALTVANQDAPGVGTFCLRCHSPIGFVRGHATPPDGSAFDKIDKQGIGCDMCHRATQAPTPDAPYYLGDAQLVFDDDQTKHGPYGDMLSPSPAHEMVKEDGLSDARFCGQCHQVTNPEVHLRGAAGEDTGVAFPLDTTYEEWAQSDFAKEGSGVAASCADCHMPKKLGARPITTIIDSPLRTDPRDHGFAGGNYWGIQAVKHANPDRVAMYPGAFEFALQRTLETLAKSVKVTLVKAPASAAPGGDLEVTVRVENLAGHKFPTGYAESRRAWIAVALVDASQHEHVLLGAYEGGHIQSAPATRVYRAQHGRWDGAQGQPSEHLALHDMIISDTRIPPKGFVATPTTTPSGDVDFSDGNGGFRAYDEATFTLAAPADLAGEVTLSARVYYQSMTPEYVEFLKTANTTDAKGDELSAIFEATGKGAPLLVASAEAKVVFPGGASTGVGGAGGAGGAGGGATGTGGQGGVGQGGTGGGAGEDGGCGCRAAGAPTSSAGAAVALLVASLLGRRRSPRRRRS